MTQDNYEVIIPDEVRQQMMDLIAQDPEAGEALEEILSKLAAGDFSDAEPVNVCERCGRWWTISDVLEADEAKCSISLDNPVYDEP